MHHFTLLLNWNNTLRWS